MKKYPFKKIESEIKKNAPLMLKNIGTMTDKEVEDWFIKSDNLWTVTKIDGEWGYYLLLWDKNSYKQQCWLGFETNADHILDTFRLLNAA